MSNQGIEFPLFLIDVRFLHTAVIKVVPINLSVEGFGPSFLSCLLFLIKIEQIGVIPKTTYRMEPQLL